MALTEKDSSELKKILQPLVSYLGTDLESIRVVVSNGATHRVMPSYLNSLPKCKETQEFDKLNVLCTPAINMLGMKFGEFYIEILNGEIGDIKTTPDYRVKKF